MNGLETIAQGMQLLFQGMFFVLGAVKGREAAADDEDDIPMF